MKKYLHTTRHSMQNSWGILQTCFQNEIRCCVQWMGELPFEYIYSILKSVVGLHSSSPGLFLIVVYLTLCLSGTASISISYCSTKHQSTEKEREKKNSTPKEEKLEIEKKREKLTNLIWAFIQNEFLIQPIKYCQKTCYTANTQSSRN